MMEKTKDLAAEISMGAIKVLREGKEKELPRGRFYAPCTTTLIKHEPYGKFLVDPGCFGEEKTLISLLKQESIFPQQISRIYVTHNHLDHCGTAGLFKGAEVVMPDSRFKVSQPNYFHIFPQETYNKPGRIVYIDRVSSVISTPGHSGWDMSLLYRSKKGLIAIVGDLFWSEEDWNNDSSYLGLCMNPEMQKRSREYVRKMKPEVIVPGHGPAFAPKY